MRDYRKGFFVERNKKIERTDRDASIGDDPLDEKETRKKDGWKIVGSRWSQVGGTVSKSCWRTGRRLLASGCRGLRNWECVWLRWNWRCKKIRKSANSCWRRLLVWRKKKARLCISLCSDGLSRTAWTPSLRGRCRWVCSGNFTENDKGRNYNGWYCRRYNEFAEGVWRSLDSVERTRQERWPRGIVVPSS